MPSYLGEFAYFNNLDAWDEGLDLINRTGISWTTWTYKVIESYGNWGIRNQKDLNINPETDSYEKIKEKWSKVGESSENQGLCDVLKKYYNMEYVAAE